MEKNKKFH